MAELSLARDFPPAQEADWQALVKEALKGAPFSSLRSVSYDGIVIEPLYARREGRYRHPWPRSRRGLGASCSALDLPDADAANAQILDDLNNAASGAVLVFEGAVGDYGYALPATEAAIRRRSKGVHLDWGVPIELDFGPPSTAGRWHRRQLREGEGARTLRGQHPLRLRSAGRHGDAGRGPQALDRARASRDRAHRRDSSSRASPAPSSSPMEDPCMPPAAQRRRSLPSRSPMPSPIFARSKRKACRLTKRAG